VYGTKGRWTEKVSGAIPLLPLWAFVACSRVTFTFTFLSVAAIYKNKIGFKILMAIFRVIMKHAL
jgi:hypothetical protein